jgi:hypothetical protein
MKKQWLPLVFAVFLLLAPVAGADDGSAENSFQQLIAQIVALIVGDDKLGELTPPFGVGAQPSDQSELGEVCPPNG